MDWSPRFAGKRCARLADSWLWPMALCRTFGHGWVVCPSLSVLVPIGLHAITALVALTVCSGFILAPPPYQMVNTGSCDCKKKKKKKKRGARDSISTRCALGTSSQVLRMLRESGDVIRYVFLPSVVLGPFILDVGGGG